ncbi:MAG: fatty acid desaturase [Gemmatimonadota bacterium]|nr:fatty acid desaturase [Gemmatimonadota bacterium]
MSWPGKTKASDFVSQELINRLLEKRDGPGLVFLAAHIGALAVTGSLIYFALETYWLVPAMAVHGTVVVHLFAPFHESNHCTAFASRWINHSVAWLAGLSIWLIPLYFRYEHIAHHNHTQIQQDDPEMIPMAERLGGYLYYATAIPYFYSNLLSLLRVPLRLFNDMELKFIPRREVNHVWGQACIMCAIYISLASLSVAMETWALVTYWVIPRVLGEPVMRLIRMTEHTGCPHVPNILLNTRTVLTLHPIRWLGWNNAYHAEHHAIPTVPFHALGDLHEAMNVHFSEIRKGYAHTQSVLIENTRHQHVEKALVNEVAG